MILYDKECNLIGIAKDVLVFLGYEDMEEFKTYNNDVADLFVNKLGYVYKFQNFSWIDYVLYSGAPNKNAIIKKKNGKEIEVHVSIREILPFGPLETHQMLYGISLQTLHNDAPSVAPLDISVSSKPLPSPQAETPLPSEDVLHVEDFCEEPSAPLPQEEEVVSEYNETGFSSLDFDDPISFSTQPSPVQEKLYINLSEEEEEIPPQQLPTATSYNIHEAILALGLEPSEFLALMEEYLGHLEMIAYALEDAIGENDMRTKNELIHQVLGTAHTFQMKQLALLLEALHEAEGTLAQELFAHFQHLISDLKNDLHCYR
ncbi:MAG: hypothetical protein IBX45_00860 [Campylobacterales bacterium]|nr:hypothetical protein [Campylobacterales bacterium]